MKKIFISLVMSAFSLSVAAEQSENKSGTVDYSIIRSAGAVCGAGLSAEAKGELDTKIMRIFGGISTAGNARFELGQVKDLIEQIPDTEGKRAIYSTYVSCVTQVVGSIVGTSKELDITPAIDNLLLPDPLVIIKNGQKFAMKIGETRAITRDSLTITIHRIYESQPGTRVINFTVTDIDPKNPRTFSGGNGQSTLVTLDKGCFLNPYQVNAEKDNEYVSFLTNCK